MTLVAQPTDRPALKPLSRSGAMEILSARLATLGHPPDYLAADAADALIAHAGGSPVRLRAALASTLFLASTEDVASVDNSLVARALQHGEIEGLAKTRSRRGRAGRGRRMGFQLAALAAAVAVAAVVTWRAAPPAVPRPPSTIGVAPTPPSRPAPAIAVIGPPPVAVRTPPPAPAPTTTSPGPTLASPGQPAAASRWVAEPVLPPDGLPVAPPATVVLLLPPRSRNTAQPLKTLTQRLQQGGITRVEIRASLLARARRPVSYFYADDLALAQHVTAVLTEQGWPRLDSNSLAPRLVLPPSGLPPRQPGLVEIQLP